MKIRLLPALAVALALGLATSGCGDAEPIASSPTSTASPSPAVTASAPPTPTTPSTTPSTTPAAPAGQRIEVSFVGGEVSGDTGRVEVPLGESVTITVVSDVADQVHLHGYDVSGPVSPGTPATLTFEATIPGVFQVELEELSKRLLSIQVA